MTRTRKILAAIFIIAALSLTSFVIYYWSQMGCGLYSLIMALVMYPSACFTIWYSIDQTIQGK